MGKVRRLWAFCSLVVLTGASLAAQGGPPISLEERFCRSLIVKAQIDPTDKGPSIDTRYEPYFGNPIAFVQLYKSPDSTAVPEAREMPVRQAPCYVSRGMAGNAWTYRCELQNSSVAIARSAVATQVRAIAACFPFADRVALLDDDTAIFVVPEDSSNTRVSDLSTIQVSRVCFGRDSACTTTLEVSRRTFDTPYKCGPKANRPCGRR